MAKKLVRVTVNSSSNRNEITVAEGGLRICTTAKPVDGEANAKIIGMLSDHFKIPKTKITIKSGHRSKIKIIEIID